MKATSVVWAAAGLLLAGATAAAVWLSTHSAVPFEEPLPSSGDALATFARLQTGMNRVSDGHPVPMPAAEVAADPLETLPEALQALLAGNTAKAVRLLDAIEEEAERRIPNEEEVAANPQLADRLEWLESYFELLPDPPGGRDVKLDTVLLTRFATVLRKVDAVLLAEMVQPLPGYDLVGRRGTDAATAFDGVWLRLPCRLVAGRRAAFEDVAKRLKQLAGPLTDCPLPAGHEADFTLAERIARDPAAAAEQALAAPAIEPQPALATPLMRAAATGAAADIARLLEAGADNHRTDARGRTALHYLLGAAGPAAPLAPAERADLARKLY